MIVGWAELLFFGFAGVMWAIQLVWPSKLVLDPNGLAFHYLFMSFHRRWVEVGQIDVVRIRSTKFVKLIAMPGGKDLTLGGAWPVSAGELVLLIEGYLARFGGASAS